MGYEGNFSCIEMSSSTTTTDDRPIMVQGSDAPIFKIIGGSDEQLICATCAGVLVDGYKPECIVGIRLQCRCGHVTQTPSLSPGDTIPSHTLSFEPGRYLIGSTVEQPASVTITSDQEVAVDENRTRPRPAGSQGSVLTQEMLAALTTELDLLSGGRFARYVESAKRSSKAGQRFFRKNPLAWAIYYLTTHLESGSLYYIQEDAKVAIGLVGGYLEVLSRWRNIVGFSSLAQDLCSSFHHTLALLITASYISDKGNKVLTNPPAKSGRSADLYVPVSRTRKLYLEVKGPEALEWPKEVMTPARLEKTIKRCLVKAKGQLGRSKPGILVIASSCVSPGFFEDLEKVIQDTLHEHGGSHQGVAAIVMTGFKEASIQMEPSGLIGFPTSYQIGIKKNPHYFEDNPVVP